MPNLLVRDLPEDVHSELQRRAQARGQSLQRYLTEELTRMARLPSHEDVLARISGRGGAGRVGLQQAADDLAAERDRR